MSIKLQVEAQKECFDLLANGYRILWQADTLKEHRVKLVNDRNGRKLTIVVTDTNWMIKEGKKVIKERSK